jgi:Outer membrane protein beta-barrel domain
MPRSLMLRWFTLICCFTGGIACAQEWEVGAIGGFGFAPDLTLQGAAGTASAGLQNGGVIGAFIGEDTREHLGGEVRYLYRDSSLKLSSDGTTTDFSGRSHIIHADLLPYFRGRESRLRPFVAFGGGVTIVQGTGPQSASQPLGRFAALINTNQVLATGDFGAGVKFNASRHLRIRFEIRDYISIHPNKVIAPAPGVRMEGILHDILPLGSLSYTW